MSVARGGRDMSVVDQQPAITDLIGLLAPELHVRAADLESIVDELGAYHARFAPLFVRQVRALPHFVGEGAWDDDAILAEHQRYVDETLGEPDGVLIIDGSDVPKQGTHSAGVARQWCGATGKKDNCQAGVFLGYASRKGAT